MANRQLVRAVLALGRQVQIEVFPGIARPAGPVIGAVDNALYGCGSG
jgi:hypothetical protein